MRKLIVHTLAAALLVPLLPAEASADPWGRGGFDRGVRREQRECEWELRNARSRREYRRELRECRREIAQARREAWYRQQYRGWGGDRHGWRDDRYGWRDDRHGWRGW